MKNFIVLIIVIALLGTFLTVGIGSVINRVWWMSILFLGLYGFAQLVMYYMLLEDQFRGFMKLLLLKGEKKG